MNTTRIVLAALVIFAAGVLTGGVGTGLAGRILRERPRREAVPAPVMIPGNARLEAMVRWTRELDLESSQRERIEIILKGAQVRLRDLWAPVAPRARGEIEAVRLEIEGLLSPIQRQRWDEARRRLGGANGANPVPENPRR